MNVHGNPGNLGYWGRFVDSDLRYYKNELDWYDMNFTQQTNLAFTAEEAAAEQAWISSLLPEALTRRT